MNTLRLRFPDAAPSDLVLESGVHTVGRGSDGRLAPIARQDAMLQVSVDRRGAWLQVRDGARGVHVNGRPVRRVALLRAGDVVFAEGSELLLLGEPPGTRNDESTASSDARVVLRGVGGLNHGRSFLLDRGCVIGRGRECEVRIDGPTVAERQAVVECESGGIVLRETGSVELCMVNGHAVREAWLRSGDQILIGAHHRFVLESSSPGPGRRVERDTSEFVDTEEPEPEPMPARRWRVPWLLIAALMLSAALSLLLLYGAG
ncbi:FHA domain-containing protein [Cognatilysobacter bugurensis]|uniref:FHA domain-containing protein n=1 Tax=Cognatilysobacter bugurensis TaxID=543356 RepID=UPI0016732B8A|nr:FHA domain-containing protein [Lysobacter bugurensis]